MDGRSNRGARLRRRCRRQIAASGASSRGRSWGGGNAIDDAAVCAFVSGVAEPWMNGIGSAGFMVVHLAATNQTVTIDYPMVSPQGATANMFPRAGSGTDRALFGWPAVVDNANIVGPRATAVPGTVAGLALALERFGTLSLAQASNPPSR